VSGYVYILAAKKNGTLCQGRSFTARYGAIRLVWYQEYQDIGEAIVAEKRIKKWRREWKIRLIEEMNPDWRELYGGMGW
jgi:putative endonuclease